MCPYRGSSCGNHAGLSKRSDFLYKGNGKAVLFFKGYETCHNTEEVLAEMNYNSENDLENPTGSVFCSHGAGFHVSWDKVDEYAHIDTGWVKAKKKTQKKFHGQAFLKFD